MSKRYMDFKPAGAMRSEKKAGVSGGKKNVSTKTTLGADAKATAEVNELEMNRIFEARQEKPKAGVSYGVRSTKDKVGNYQKKFVRTAVEKRPLSKTAASQKKVKEPEVTKELKKDAAPVTIIDKPEKESRGGLIVTIIITIILGAAAGVVAFLLLPK